jgi:PII-like signaling protein
MLQAGTALKVTVYLNEDTGSNDGFLTEDLLKFLLDRGIEGATVVHAHAGFGAHRRIHRSDSAGVGGEHLPVILSFIDEVAKVRSLLPELLTMVTDGLVEAHSTEILKDVSGLEKVLA